MRKIPLFFLILIITNLAFNFVLADFGESSDSLGQITDEFTSLDNVSVRVLIERNATFNAMELNWTEGSGSGSLNFSAFTEADEDADLTVLAGSISWVTIRRDAETYLWRDDGAGKWGDFYHEFVVNITDLEAGDITAASVAAFDVMSNNTGVIDDLQASNWIGVFMAQNQDVDDSFYFGVWERKAGGTVAIQSTGVNHAVNDPLYFIHNRTGANMDLYIFSNPARTILVASASIAGNGDVYQYHQPFSNWGRNVDPADHHTGDLSDFNRGGTSDQYANSGYFTTTDHLSGINGSVLIQLTNATIPAGTGITVEFIDDNSTWVNEKNVTGAVTLTEGFNAIDLRELNWSTAHYVRYNMTGNSLETPRLYQSRLITTIGEGAGVVTVTVIESDFPWIAIAIILMCIAYLVLRSK